MPARGLALSVGLIVVAGVLTFSNSLAGPFIWDDLTSIQQNQTLRRVWPISAALSPPRETPVGGRPLVNLSFAVNYAIGGLDVSGYHVGNIAIHIACALTLFGLVRRTLLGPRLRDRFGPSANGVALVSALLWMVHPLQTEPVDYLTQRTESMMGLFWLLTLYCAMRARHSARATRWLAASVLACALGMACKESMATAPLIVLLYDGIFEFDSFRQAIQARWRLYAALAATWVELAALISSLPRSTVGTSSGVGVWTYLLNQCEMIVQYLRLTLWPRALVLDYGLPHTRTIRDVLPQTVVVVSLLLATAVALVRWKKVGFLCAAFFLTLAPTTSLIPIASEVGAERRMYLPLAALAVLAALAGWSALDRLGARSGKPSRRIALVGATLAAGVVAVLATRTVYRNAEYASPLALWRSVVERRPHGRARSALASELIAAGSHDEAIGSFQRVASLDPQSGSAQRNLAQAYLQQGNAHQAELHAREAVRLSPRDPAAHNLLADALASQQQLDEAIDQFRQTLQISPADARAREGLARALGLKHSPTRTP